MTRSKATAERAGITVGVWDGAGGRLAPIAAAHNAGAIDLPARIVDLARKAAELGDVAGPAKVTAMRHAIRNATGSERARLEDAQRRHEATMTARHHAGQAVRLAFRAEASGIGAALEDALDEVLERARPDVPLLGRRFDYTDPGAAASLEEDGLAAWSRLVGLAKLHDVIRRAAIGLAIEVERQGTAAADATDVFGADRFVGAGARGPARHLRGSGSRDYAHTWAWDPTVLEKDPHTGKDARRSTNPVERLAAAVRSDAAPARELEEALA